jgi:hypothetical protein
VTSNSSAEKEKGSGSKSVTNFNEYGLAKT